MPQPGITSGCAVRGLRRRAWSLNLVGPVPMGHHHHDTPPPLSRMAERTQTRDSCATPSPQFSAPRPIFTPPHCNGTFPAESIAEARSRHHTAKELRPKSCGWAALLLSLVVSSFKGLRGVVVGVLERVLSF